MLSRQVGVGAAGLRRAYRSTRRSAPEEQLRMRTRWCVGLRDAHRCFEHAATFSATMDTHSRKALPTPRSQVQTSCGGDVALLDQRSTNASSARVSAWALQSRAALRRHARLSCPRRAGEPLAARYRERRAACATRVASAPGPALRVRSEQIRAARAVRANARACAGGARAVSGACSPAWLRRAPSDGVAKL
jgi:hypothetical protein